MGLHPSTIHMLIVTSMEQSHRHRLFEGNNCAFKWERHTSIASAKSVTKPVCKTQGKLTFPASSLPNKYMDVLQMDTDSE